MPEKRGWANTPKSGDWLAEIKLRGEDTMTSEVLVFFDAFSLHEPVATSLENALSGDGNTSENVSQTMPNTAGTCVTFDIHFDRNPSRANSTSVVRP